MIKKNPKFDALGTSEKLSMLIRVAFHNISMPFTESAIIDIIAKKKLMNKNEVWIEGMRVKLHKDSNNHIQESKEFVKLEEVLPEIDKNDPYSIYI